MLQSLSLSGELVGISRHLSERRLSSEFFIMQDTKIVFRIEIFELKTNGRILIKLKGNFMKQY